MALSQFLSSLSELADPRVNDYLLMQSPIQLITIQVLYLTFVLKLGPMLMNKRQAFDLKPLLVLYNWVQIVWNLVIFLMFLRILPNLSFVCTPVDVSNTPTAIALIKIHHNYTVLKVFDLFDTVLFVLRKKNRQISFLHVYHHNLVLFVSWISCKYFPGGIMRFLILFNSVVHFFMYIHYLVSALNLGHIQGGWWKKYLTMLQIGQHYLLLLVLFFHLVNPNCLYPTPWVSFILVNQLLLTYLFTRFYKQNYGKEK